MPARTNDFQKLVHTIETALAPKGAVVRESVECAVEGLATTREVDVLIEGEFGSYRMKVAVEASDDARKFSLPDFDSLVAKYRGPCNVQVDKFVIVTRNGYSDGVLEKANRLDIELLTLAEAEIKDWATIAPKRFQFRVPPHICKIEFDPPIVTTPPKKLWNQGRMICPNGHDHGSVLEIAQFHTRQLFKSRPELVGQFKAVVEKSPNGENYMSFTVPMKDVSIQLDGTERKINEMTVALHGILASGSVKCTGIERTSTRGTKEALQRIEATAGDRNFSIVIPAGRRPERIALRIDAAEPLTANVKKTRRDSRNKAEKKRKSERPAARRRNS